MRRARSVCVGCFLIGVCTGALASEQDREFDGKMSRPVLEGYMSRAITVAELLNGRGNVDDNVRMLTNTGARFAGRAVYHWGGEDRLEGMLPQAAHIARQVHQANPDIILQACVFEIVTTRLGRVSVPRWVFEAFGIEPETRHFRYADMLYPGKKLHDHWNQGASVPDISRLETRMWFFYASKVYIDIGVEAVHFGQVEIMDDRDPGHRHWADLLQRVRRYAARNARRRFVLCDAHVPSGGIVCDGRLLFDFHSFPLRIDEVPDQPEEGVLRMGYLDSIFGRSKGGVTPSGWRCEHLPYLAEIDNWGRHDREGENVGGGWIWGYDEISWFARQSEEYRNDWLRYAWRWIREHDPNGFLQMPGSRPLASPVGGKIGWYFANTPSAPVLTGFNQEETIKAIWAEDR